LGRVMGHGVLRCCLLTAAVVFPPNPTEGFFTGELNGQKPVLLSSDHLVPLCFPAVATHADLQQMRRRCCYPKYKEYASNCLGGVFNAWRCCRNDDAFRSHAEAVRQQLLACRAASQGQSADTSMTPYAFSRHSPLGHLVWCAAQRAATAFDLFMGEGGSALLLADSMRSRPGAQVVTFEHLEGEMFQRMLRNLAEFNPEVVEISNTSLEELKAVLTSSGLKQLLTVFHGSPYPEYSTDDLEDFDLEPSHLTVLCEALRPDLIVIDAPTAIVREWHVLELKCRPSTVLIFNTNLPGHNGWIRDQLLTRGDWAEVLTGVEEDPYAHMYRGLGSLLALRHWSLLIRDTAGNRTGRSRGAPRQELT